MLEEPLFSTAEFVTFRVRQRQCGVFLSNAIPEVLDELKTFRAAKFQEWCEFGIHEGNVVVRLDSFNRVVEVNTSYQELADPSQGRALCAPAPSWQRLVVGARLVVHARSEFRTFGLKWHGRPAHVFDDEESGIVLAAKERKERKEKTFGLFVIYALFCGYICQRARPNQSS